MGCATSKPSWTPQEAPIFPAEVALLLDVGAELGRGAFGVVSVCTLTKEGLATRWAKKHGLNIGSDLCLKVLRRDPAKSVSTEHVNMIRNAL